MNSVYGGTAAPQLRFENLSRGQLVEHSNRYGRVVARKALLKEKQKKSSKQVDLSHEEEDGLLKLSQNETF